MTVSRASTIAEVADNDPLATLGAETMEPIRSSARRTGDEDSVSRPALSCQGFDAHDRESVLGTHSITANGDMTLTTHGACTIVNGGLVFSHVLQPNATAMTSRGTSRCP